MPMKGIWVQSLHPEDPLEKKRQLSPVFLPGKYHEQNSLEGYSPWSCKRVGHNLVTQPHIQMNLHVAKRGQWGRRIDSVADDQRKMHFESVGRHCLCQQLLLYYLKSEKCWLDLVTMEITGNLNKDCFNGLEARSQDDGWGVSES